jgi:hypothetical protein
MMITEEVAAHVKDLYPVIPGIMIEIEGGGETTGMIGL